MMVVFTFITSALIPLVPQGCSNIRRYMLVHDRDIDSARRRCITETFYVARGVREILRHI